MFLQWNTTVAKIVRSNILASNGIIHIIDKLFIDLPEVPTTVSPDGTTKKSAHVNSAVLHCSFKSLTLIILSFCVYIFLSWFYMLIFNKLCIFVSFICDNPWSWWWQDLHLHIRFLKPDALWHCDFESRPYQGLLDVT